MAIRPVKAGSVPAAVVTASVRAASSAIRIAYRDARRSHRGNDLAIVVEDFRLRRLTPVSISVFSRMPSIVSPEVGRIGRDDLDYIAKLLVAHSRDRNWIPVLYVNSAGVSVRHIVRLALVKGVAA